MKKLLFCLMLLPGLAFGQTTVNDLVGLGMSSELAELVVALGTTVIPNDTCLEGDNSVGTDVCLIGVAADDDTVIKSDDGNTIELYPGTDDQRFFSFQATSDTAFQINFGNYGVTATQDLLVTSGTGDADDDSTISIAGGGAVGAGRGSSVVVAGEDTSGGGDLDLYSSAGDVIRLNPESDANRLFTFGGASDTALSLTFGDATDAQTFLISSSSADADDNDILTIAGGGATGNGRGAYITLGGEDATGGGDIDIASSAGDVIFISPAASTTATFSAASTSLINDFIVNTAGANFLKGASSVTSDVTADTTAEPQIFISGASGTQSQLALLEPSAGTNPVQIYAFKSRATDGTGDTIVTAGDDALRLTAFGSDGVDFEPLAGILMESGGSPGSNDMPGSLSLQVTPDGAAALVPALTLTVPATTSIVSTYGDTTASQTHYLSAGTSDASDTSKAILCGGGGAASCGSNGRGAFIQIEGNEVNSGRLLLNSGSAGSVFIETAGGGITVDSDGDALFTDDITSSKATTIGWSIVAGADTACTTTCTNACVVGFDNGAGDAEALVDCANATADVCLCAGAN